MRSTENQQLTVVIFMYSNLVINTIREFESRRGEILNLFAKTTNGSTTDTAFYGSRKLRKK